MGETFGLVLTSCTRASPSQSRNSESRQECGGLSVTGGHVPNIETTSCSLFRCYVKPQGRPCSLALASGYTLESIVLRNPNRTTTMSMDAIPDSEGFLESSMITVIVRLHLQNTFRGR